MDIEQRAENISNLIASILDTHNDHDMLQIHELSFAWAMLEYMNDRILKIPSLLSDKTFMSSRDKMTNEVQKYSSALGLNRSQRMKLEQQSTVNPLADIL